MLFVAGLLAALTGVLGLGGASSSKRSPRRFNGGGLHRNTSNAFGRLAALTGVVGAIGNVATSSGKRKDKQPPRRLNGGGWASEHSGG